MSKPKISDSINLPVGAAFAVIITFTVPELAGLAWILFVAAFVIKFLDFFTFFLRKIILQKISQKKLA